MAVNGGNNWASERLENICNQITDGKHGDCQDEANSGFYFLSCKDVSDGKLNYDGARQIAEVDFLDTHRRTKLAPADVLITNSGTIGRMALAPDNQLTPKTTFQKSVAILKPIVDRVEPSFLYYALQADIQRLIEFAGGTAQKNLLLRDLRAFEVRVPPLPVQRRIAGILSAYDELIENSQRRISILEAIARALYREWFVHFRFPGHDNQLRIPSALGEIPKGWAVKRFGEAFQTVLGATPSRGKPEYWEGGTVPWINSGKVNELRITEASELITQLALEKSAAKLMPKGTTVLAITGATLGQVSYLEIETCANQSVVGIVDPSALRSEWIYLTVRERIESIIKHASGGAQQHINKDMSARDIGDIAAWFASRPAIPGAHPTDGSKVAAGEKAVHDASCASCHGATFAGEGVSPRLAGQSPLYLAQQLEAFAAARRAHPEAKALFSAPLDPEAVAHYLASLK